MSALRIPARLIQRQPLLRPRVSAPSTSRLLSTTIATPFPRKDSQARDSISTDATEYSKSGSDDAAAHQEDAAFDPGTTDPAAEKDKAGQGNSQNPLEVSPANPEVSKQRSNTEGGAEGSPNAERGKTSGGGSGPKGTTLD